MLQQKKNRIFGLVTLTGTERPEPHARPRALASPATGVKKKQLRRVEKGEVGGQVGVDYERKAL